MSRVLTGALLVLSALATAGALARPEPTAVTTPAIAGEWWAVALDGAPLPASVRGADGAALTLDSATVRLGPGGRFVRRLWLTQGASRFSIDSFEHGTWHRDGDVLVLSSAWIAGGVSLGAIDEQTLRLQHAAAPGQPPLLLTYITRS